MKNDFSLWTQRTKLSINEAALLIVGLAPSPLPNSPFEAQIDDKAQLTIFQILSDSLCKAVERYEILTTNHVTTFDFGDEYASHSDVVINRDETFITKDNLTLWLTENEISAEFFQNNISESTINKLTIEKKAEYKRLAARYERYISKIIPAVEEIEKIRSITTWGEYDIQARQEEALLHFDQFTPDGHPKYPTHGHLKIPHLSGLKF